MKTNVGFGLALVTFLLSAPVWADSRTFVSGTGSDYNFCTVSQPCRTFARAFAETDKGGEIVARDSADYGRVTITRSVTIEAAGVYAGVPVSSQDGITINAGASDVVILRGLTIYGAGGSTGIKFNSGSALHVENCVINGIDSGTAIDCSSTVNLFVKDTIIRANESGIVTHAGSMASLERVRLEGNATGIDVDSGVASISNSVVSGNTNIGIFATFTAGNPAAGEINVESCLVANNNLGIVSREGATVRLSNSTVTDNSTGLFQGPGSKVLSRVNNTIEGNAAGNTAPGTYSAK